MMHVRTHTPLINTGAEGWRQPVQRQDEQGITTTHRNPPVGSSPQNRPICLSRGLELAELAEPEEAG